MLIRYIIKHFEGKGRGIVADQFVKKGQIISDITMAKKIVFYKEDDFIKWSKDKKKSELDDWYTYSFASQGVLYYLFDDCKLFNHSSTPNTIYYNKDISKQFARIDIEKGEEILDDYGHFDSIEWVNKYYNQYGFPSDRDYSENFKKENQHKE